MSNALEAMAKAKWEAAALRIFGHGVSDGNGLWAALGKHARDGLAADMRPVLLALSEVELSGHLDWIAADEDQAKRCTEELSAICRSIAEEGK